MTDYTKARAVLAAADDKSGTYNEQRDRILRASNLSDAIAGPALELAEAARKVIDTRPNDMRHDVAMLTLVPVLAAFNAALTRALGEK